MIIEKDGIIHYRCAKCLIFLPIDKYYLKKKKNIPGGYCMDCDKIYRSVYNNTLRGFILRRLSGAKHHITNKSKKRNEKCKEFTLTIDDLFDRIIEQHGKCYYSDIPLVFKEHSEWMCSIERINNEIGYTKENIVLVCSEFNTMDASVLATNEICGSSQWSKDKFKYLMDHINKK